MYAQRQPLQPHWTRVSHRTPDWLHNTIPYPGRQDAVCHVARIHRVLSLKRGNLMLVGVGGSGRQSLTRLAAYICGQELFTIEIAKNYRQVRQPHTCKR